MFKVSREILLQRLESVSPGLTKKEEFQQSDMFVFQKGRVYTFNEELACKHWSKFPKDLEMAVPAKQLMGILRTIPEDDLEVEIEEGLLKIKPKGRKMIRVRIKGEVHLPLEAIEKPGEWTNIDPDFEKAVLIARSIVDDKDPVPKFRCLHVTPDFVESTDNNRVIRYDCQTGFEREVLVPSKAIAAIAGLGMTQFSLVQNWVHFKNPDGLIFSCCLEGEPEKFPKAGKVLKIEGSKVKIPKSIISTMDCVRVFANLVQVNFSEGLMSITSDGDHGGFDDAKKVDYSGEEISFCIKPGNLADLVDKSQQCEVTTNFIKANGGKFVYLMEYQKPEAKED